MTQGRWTRATLSQVSTPNGIATGMVVASSASACAIACASTSKCGVSPRMRQPSGTTASNLPVLASAATAGASSNEPATSKRSTLACATCALSSAAFSSALVMSSFQRARTTATRALGWDNLTPAGDFPEAGIAAI